MMTTVQWISRELLRDSKEDTSALECVGVARLFVGMGGLGQI